MSITRTLKLGPLKRTTVLEPGYEEVLAKRELGDRIVTVESINVLCDRERRIGGQGSSRRHFRDQINEAEIRARKGLMRTVEFGFVPSKERY